jgi:hypothetical protein
MRPAQVAAKDRKYQQLLGFLRILGLGESKKQARAENADGTEKGKP